jgi:hypothetical protein
MSKAFSVASWNVEHFKDDPARVDRVVAFLKQQKPDVFGLYEVEGATIFETVTTHMPGYSFHITEGPQVQEILIGVAPELTGFVTQRTEFKAGVSLLRPGALLTVTVEGENYILLFLHTASGNDPRGLGLRDDMLTRAVKFRRVLDNAPGTNGCSNYLFLGDLNTMGMQYVYARDRDIDTATELKRLAEVAKRAKMRLLVKDFPESWWSGQDAVRPSNLDQVVAADHLRFKKFGDAEVTVLGWPKLPDSERPKWIDQFSDHGMMYFEVEKISTS